MYNYEDSYEETGIDENVVQDALFGMLCGDWSVEDTALNPAGSAPSATRA